MSSKTQRKIQFARNRGIYVAHVQFPKSMPTKTGWWVIDDSYYLKTGDNTDIGIEYGPYLSKRAAKNVAYRLAVGQKAL